MQITVTNNQCIEGLSKTQKNKIKDALTYDNPKYKQAKRYGRSKYISIPPYLQYYEDNGTSLTVPFGFNISSIISNCPTPIFNTNRVNVDYPELKIELRDDQRKALQGFVSYKRPFNKLENTYGVIQLPTGKGKTILAIYMAHHFNQKALILVHKDDLVVGWTNDILKCFDNKISVGLIKAKKRVIGEQFTIATVQTLARMSEEELSQYTNQFGMIIQDECLTGDTLVVKSDGSVTTIPNIYDNCDIIGGKVSHSFSRKSKIYQLNCNNAIIKGSPTHKTWCVRKKSSSYQYGIGDFEVKKIEDLNSDYLVPVIYKIPHTTRNNTQPYYAKFCAMIMCDGHLDKLPSRRVKVNVSKDRRYYRSIFEEFCDNTNYTFKASLDCRRNLTLWCNDEVLKNDLNTTWGIDCGKKSNTIKIPDFMYSAPIDTIKAFIETCFNCEGDLSISEYNSCRYNFNTCSYQFAQGLSMLLKKFGVLCSIHTIKRTNPIHNTIYRLSISGYFFNVFADTFTLLPRKTTTRRNSQNTKTHRFLGDFYLSQVNGVEDLGYEDTVYDFEVSMTHTFIANGLVTHNCHHVGANSFNIVDKFNCQFKIGLSATPTRTDGLNQCFDLFFGGIVYKHKYSKDDKDILPVEVRVKETKAKYRPFVIKNKQGVYATDQFFNMYDYDISELPKDFKTVDSFDYRDKPRVPYLVTDNAVVLDRRYKIMVCKDIIKEVRQGHSCLALFTQKEHIEQYNRYLCRFLPKNLISLYYGDSKEKSEVLMKRAENREVLVTLGTFAKATEGTNVKAWEVLFLVSSINNEKNVEQATGRIRRSSKNKLNPVVVYDYIHPNVVGIQSHYTTRKSVYNRLEYSVKYLNGKSKETRSSGSLFSRGY